MATRERPWTRDTRTRGRRWSARPTVAISLGQRLGVGLLLGLLVLVGEGGCGSQLPAKMEAADLVGAEFTDLFPSTSDGPSTYSLDLSDAWLRDRLLSAYASMTAWSGDAEGLPEPDVQLALLLTDERRIVLSLAREDHAYVQVDLYKGGKLETTSSMQPKLMYDFMNELVIEPGGW